MSPGRKQIRRIQALQLTDAAVAWLGFWLASILRNPIREWAGMVPMAGRSVLLEMSWVLYITVPFTPLLLEYFGFYREARRKSGREAILQIAKTLAVMGVVLGSISFFCRLQDAGRLILGLGIPIMAFLLLLRDRIACRWMRAPEHF